MEGPRRDPPTPVRRSPLFLASTLSVHDNVCLRSDPSVSTETRPLEYHEVVFPRSGVWIRHLASARHVVDAGRAHLFARGDAHRVSHPRRCGDRNTGIALSDVALAGLDPRSHERRAFPVPAVPVGERVYAEHCGLVNGLRRGTVDALEAEERALALVDVVLAAARALRDAPPPPRLPSPAARRRRRDLAHGARSLLATRFDEGLALGDVARELDTSVHHLCRVFRAEFGVSLHGFRRSLRLRAAARLLLDTSLTLYDVAARSGFSDRTRLSHAFRSVLGESPTALRRRLSKKRHARTSSGP